VQRAPGKVFLPETGMALDFGGFGKEYAVDIAAQIATEHGLSGALVDFGHFLFQFCLQRCHCSIEARQTVFLFFQFVAQCCGGLAVMEAPV
jgi:hypothetical protein